MIQCLSDINEYKKLSFEVNQVVGKGRPKFTMQVGYAKAYTPQKTRDYERLVQLSYLRYHKYCSSKSLRVMIYIYINPNKNDSKKLKIAKLSNEVLPNKKPDIDNVVKAILDALNGVAYKDDTQINDLVVRRRHGLTEKVKVTIEEIGEIE